MAPHRRIGLATDIGPLRSQSSGASFGYAIVWIMSQGILIHTYGECSARIEPPLVLISIPRTFAEAAEIRARQGLALIANSRGTAYHARTGMAWDGNGCTGLDVQVKIEQSIMADYDPRATRKHRLLWERSQSTSTTGCVSYTDEWELSSAREEGIAY